VSTDVLSVCCIHKIPERKVGEQGARVLVDLCTDLRITSSAVRGLGQAR
jgi:hypothetical protein